MRPTALALALGVALAVVATARIAHAVERPCPSGQIWDPNRGACVQKKKVKRKSPEDKYYEALEHLEGRAKNPSVAKAVALLEDACTRKLGEACTQLGFVYLRGRGVTADPAKAVEHYERACKLGDNDGCIGAADVYATGVLGKIDHGRAAKLLDGACKGGSGRACHELAGKYQRALGVAEDATKAAALYKQAFGMLEGECGKGVGASCDLVGVMYRDGEGATFDLAKAVAAFDRGCQGGAGDACYHLGALAQNGTGVPLDLDRAYGLYESACQRYDHQDSCFEAGAMLALGQVQRDLKVLEPMAQRACQLSQARCDLLGYILGDGIGVTQDLAASARWYDVACGQGNGVACRVMGQKYLDGTGVALNVKTAVKYWEQACDLSEGLGCFRAGQYHYWGDDASGLKVDQARAFELLHLACLRDDRDACQWAGELLTLGKDGTGVEKPEQGILYFQAGCQLGLGQSCSWAGELYLDGRATGTPDPGGAIEYLENGCFFDVEPQTYACHKTVELRRTGAGVAKDVAVAVRAQTKLCALGDAEECVAADTMIGEEGLGDDEKQALRATAEAACAPAADGSRNEGACVAIAWLMRAGSNAYAKDGHGAVARFEESCARGYQHACVLAGETYEFGLGVVANTDKARALYGGACDGGYQHACYSLANLLTSNGQAKEALGLLQTACDGGHASACNVLGFAYYTARGARWDVVEADRLYARACELGDAVGCSNVGEMYQYGIAHDPDPAKAFELYTKACDLGFAGGCGRSAYYLERGEGGAEKNAELAEARYTAACEGDSPEACRALAELLEGGGRTAHSKIAQLKQRAFDGAKDLAEKNPYYAYVLGTFHRDGVATVKDAAKAAELFVTACDGYDPLGCLAAGRLYMGTDVDAGALPPNPELAAVQLDKACAANVAVACRLAEEAHTGRPGAKLPLGPKKGGCACSSRGGAPGGGAWLLLGLTALGLRRRR